MPRLRLVWLFRISPVGVVGALVSGIANGTFWSLAPVFAERSGLSPGGVASFMTAAIVGAALVQWPVGRLADRSDRRHIMLVAIAIAVAAQGAAGFLRKERALVLIALAALRRRLRAGALSARLQPRAGPRRAAKMPSRSRPGLLLAYTIGAIVGPTTAAWMMGWIGPQALFIHNGAIHVLFVIFIVWRLWQRPPRQEGKGLSDVLHARTRPWRRATATRLPRPCSRRMSTPRGAVLINSATAVPPYRFSEKIVLKQK